MSVTSANQFLSECIIYVNLFQLKSVAYDILCLMELHIKHVFTHSEASKESTQKTTR